MGCTQVTESEAPILEPDHFPQSDTVNRGGMGLLTTAELATLQSLAWPQSYLDMKGTFGLANRSTEAADIYLIQGSAQQVWVFYTGRTATGYEVK
ncbi:MAG: hypothetical protein F6K42_05225 [Leptolyngbya sp. SIO1D8]|nr:hypothetical protein [Leptolyngbya sp. SIO1D8]